MKRKLWIILALTALIGLLWYGTALADESGSCGDNVTYSFVSDTGTLTISGTGAITNLTARTYANAPWYSYGSQISSIVIESGVTSIGDYAFTGCAVTEVTIPGNVNRIGSYAFRNCSLTTITVLNPDAVFGSGVFDRRSGTSGQLLKGWADSTAQSYASSNGHPFESLGSRTGQLGDNVYYSFDTATGAVCITGKGSMWDYDSTSHSPFYQDAAVINVYIDSGVTTIGEYAFYGCNGLTNVTIPNSVTSIGRYAFYNCTGLTSVTIPNSVTSIGEGAFYYCTGLTSVTIPNSVDSIGSDAFSYCTGLTSIAVEAGNSAYSADGGVLFDKSKKTLICYPAGKTGSYTIPNSVTGIGEGVFYYCTGLTSVTIPNSVTSIDSSAFEDCTGLTSVTIPNSVTSIGDYAFYNCTGLTSVTIPNSVDSIGRYAFYNCTGLKDVSVHNAEAEFGSSVFGGCTLNLHGHSGSTAETYAAGDSNITFVALTAKMGTPDFVLPAYLTAIKAEAFSGVKATVVYIPDGVTSLGSMAFSYCTSLKQIRIPASVTVIPPDVFYGLSSSQLHAITVFGTPGSAAETYANSKGMKFEVE